MNIMNKITREEGGYYEIAKNLPKTLSQTNLNASHLAIIWCILDYTWGWKDPDGTKMEKKKNRKTESLISNEQFCEYSGIKITKIIEYLKQLSSWNIIKVTKENMKKIYSFNRFPQDWDLSIWRKSGVKRNGSLKQSSPNREQLRPTNSLNREPEFPNQGTAIPYIVNNNSLNREPEFPNQGTFDVKIANNHNKIPYPNSIIKPNIKPNINTIKYLSENGTQSEKESFEIIFQKMENKFEKIFGSIEKDQMKAWVRTYPLEDIIYAIEKSANSSIPYIKKIIQNWQEEKKKEKKGFNKKPAPIESNRERLRIAREKLLRKKEK